MGQEMIAWLTHLQHTRGKNVWFVGILDERLDDFNRRVFSLQIDGSKTGLELPGIVDEVVTLAEPEGRRRRQLPRLRLPTLNAWGYPAKDRSGRLDPIEEPHLGRLMERSPARPGPLPSGSISRPCARRHPHRIHFHSGVLIMTYFDFNSASEQTSFDLIPKGTLVRVRMTIKPGGFDDPSQGWTGGCHPQRQHRLGVPELRVRRDGG